MTVSSLHRESTDSLITELVLYRVDKRFLLVLVVHKVMHKVYCAPIQTLL